MGETIVASDGKSRCSWCSSAPDLLSLLLFKSELELDLNKSRACINQEDIYRHITEIDHAVHGATRVATINLTGSTFM